MKVEQKYNLKSCLGVSAWAAAVILLVSSPARAGEDSVDLSELASIVPGVLVSVDRKTAGVGGGTAFVVSKSGILATAYHSIFEAVMQPVKYQISLIVPGRVMQA